MVLAKAIPWLTAAGAHLLLRDTEGFGVGGTPAEYDAHVFMLTTSLGAHVLYVTMGGVHRAEEEVIAQRH